MHLQRGKIDTPITQIHRQRYLIGRRTSIKRGVVIAEEKQLSETDFILRTASTFSSNEEKISLPRSF